MSADWTRLPDLAARSLGGSVVYANDEFFAARDNLVTDAAPSFEAQTFGPKGQVYDGWETRRRREPGEDHAIVRLGAPGIVRGVVVDTSFFTGNYPPYASVEACAVAGYPAPEELSGWITVVPRSPLHGDSRNAFVVTDPHRFTHVRLTIYPDGGVARLRVHGDVVPDPELLPAVLDLAAMEHGGLVVACSNMFYGPPHRLIAPGLARVMGRAGRPPAVATTPTTGPSYASPRPAGYTSPNWTPATSRATRQGRRACAGSCPMWTIWTVLTARTAGSTCCRAPASSRTRDTASGSTPTAPPRTCASTSSRTAAWPASACTASQRRPPAPP
ncbi:hypothetical protein Prum_064500 [Phytohabitans rumicis]|uniref:Allantoicase domain-containing protein n=1 Tax=Phytohabitans rumicis TaxID=1076125 RepID=A0A6V8LCV2_9ACTN|nr:hypothetical protein Prum_064500 [Phytohabitans rumicis]